MAKDYDGDGRWVTINGHRVFITEGQSIGDAIRKSGKLYKNKTNFIYNDKSKSGQSIKDYMKEEAEKDIKEKTQPTKFTIKNDKSKETDRNIDKFDDEPSSEMQRRSNAKYDYNTPGKIGNLDTKEFIRQKNEFESRADALYKKEDIDGKYKKVTDEVKSGNITRKEAYDKLNNIQKDYGTKLDQISKDYSAEAVALEKPEYSKKSKVLERATERMTPEQRKETFKARLRLSKQEREQELQDRYNSRLASEKKEKEKSDFIRNAISEKKVKTAWRNYRQKHPNSDISLDEFKDLYQG